MIPYIYKPILAAIGPIKIYTWGLFAALGFFSAYLLLIKKSKLEKKHLENIFSILLVSSIIGSRILYLVEYPPETFYSIIKIWEGGLSLYGGIILAVFFSYLYIKKHKLSFIKYANDFTLPLVLGLIFGRIGCTLGDGGHLGKAAPKLIGALVNSQYLHYTSVYSIIALVLIFIVLVKIKRRFTYFLILYPAARFLIDLARADPVYFGLTIAQYFSIVTFIIGLILLFYNES